jgi:hypothetical protein
VSCPDGTKVYAELSRLGRQRFLKAVAPWLLKQHVREKQGHASVGGCDPPQTFFEYNVARAEQEARFAEGRFERLPTLADAHDPIVFADPLAEGLVGSPEAGWLVITPVWNTDA